VPFGKGSRICVGMSYVFAMYLRHAQTSLTSGRLAYCEVYVTIAMLFHRFEHLKGNKLTTADLVYDDYFASHHAINATKFHVMKG